MKLEWNQTSLLASLVYNSALTKSSDRKSPDYFNPFKRQKTKRREINPPMAENTGKLLVETFCPRR